MAKQINDLFDNFDASSWSEVAPSLDEFMNITVIFLNAYPTTSDFGDGFMVEFIDTRTEKIHKIITQSGNVMRFCEDMIANNLPRLPVIFGRRKQAYTVSPNPNFDAEEYSRIINNL